VGRLNPETGGTCGSGSPIGGNKISKELLLRVISDSGLIGEIHGKLVGDIEEGGLRDTAQGNLS